MGESQQGFTPSGLTRWKGVDLSSAENETSQEGPAKIDNNNSKTQKLPLPELDIFSMVEQHNMLCMSVSPSRKKNSLKNRIKAQLNDYPDLVNKKNAKDQTLLDLAFNGYNLEMGAILLPYINLDKINRDQLIFLYATDPYNKNIEQRLRQIDKSPQHSPEENKNFFTCLNTEIKKYCQPNLDPKNQEKLQKRIAILAKYSNIYKLDQIIITFENPLDLISACYSMYINLVGTKNKIFLGTVMSTLLKAHPYLVNENNNQSKRLLYLLDKATKKEDARIFDACMQLHRSINPKNINSTENEFNKNNSSLIKKFSKLVRNSDHCHAPKKRDCPSVEKESFCTFIKRKLRC